MVRITSFLPATATMRWQERLARLPLVGPCGASAPEGASAWLILTSDSAVGELGALLFVLRAAPVPVACLIHRPALLRAAASSLPRLAMLLCPTLDDLTLTQVLRLLPSITAGLMLIGFPCRNI